MFLKIKMGKSRWISFCVFPFFPQYVTELWSQREAGSWIILTVCFRFLADSHNGTNGWWKIMELWGAPGNIGMAAPGRGTGRPLLSNRFWHARVKFKSVPLFHFDPWQKWKHVSSSVCVLIFCFTEHKTFWSTCSGVEMLSYNITKYKILSQYTQTATH